MNPILVVCLLGSGASSLIYELLWTRILGFSFGATALAFAAVLAVFFLGLALGAQWAGSRASRLLNPVRFYGWLEAGIGLYAALSFPFLFQLDRLFALVNASGTEPIGLIWRFALAAAVLLIPTMAMGATFPVLLEHLRREKTNYASQLGLLYGINTLGACLGVYLATHWFIPRLGLNGAYACGVALNTVVFLLSLSLRSNPVNGKTVSTAESISPHEPSVSSSQSFHRIGLLLLAVSGFTTLGYEIVWSRVLSICLEGSIYGIGATLGSFLVGIGLGGLLWSWIAHRFTAPKNVLRLYVIVCISMTLWLALSPLILPIEGYLLRAISFTHRNTLGLHLIFMISALFLLPITVGLGVLFPAAMSLLHRDRMAKHAGTAYALNTTFSVLGSVLTAAWLMQKLGIEGIVWINVILLLTSLFVAVWFSEKKRNARWFACAPVLLVLLCAIEFWPEINAKSVLVHGYDGKALSLGGLFRSLSVRFNESAGIKVYRDGVGTTLTITQSGRGYGVQSNGLAQSGRSLDPPHFNLESSLVGLIPALHQPNAHSALVIGLGAGITTSVLRKAGVEKVEVVELEPSMPAICRYMYPKGKSPLDDSGVTLTIDDARNFLLRNRYAKHKRYWPLIASQPAHPWVSGAADLFTEDMFRLVYEALEPNGVFGQWFMPSGLDAKAYQSVTNAFGRVFDQVAIYRSFGGFDGFYFIGVKGHNSLNLPAIEKLFQREALRSLLALNNHTQPSDILRYQLAALTSGKNLVENGPINTDRSAYIETRMPLLPKQANPGPEAFSNSFYSGPTLAEFSSLTQAESLVVYDAIDALVRNSWKRNRDSDSSVILRLQLFAQRATDPIKPYEEMLLKALQHRLTPTQLIESLKKASGLEQGVLLRLFLIAFDADTLPPWPDQSNSWPPAFSSALKGKYAFELAEGNRLNEAIALLKTAPFMDRRDSLLIEIMSEEALNSTSNSKNLAISDSLFDSAYALAVQRYREQPKLMKALTAHCRHSHHVARADALDNLLDQEKLQSLQFLQALAETQKKGGQLSKAVETLEHAINLAPSIPTTYWQLGEILGSLREPSAFAVLTHQLSTAFPLDELAAYRLREVYDIAYTNSPSAGPQ